MRVSDEGNQPPIPGSEISVETLTLPVDAPLECGADDADTIAYVTHVSGPAHTSLDNAALVLKYIATNTK